MRPGGRGRRQYQQKQKLARQKIKATTAAAVEAAGTGRSPMSRIQNTKNLETSSEAQASSPKLRKEVPRFKRQAASLKLQAASDKLYNFFALIKFHGASSKVLR